MKMVWGLGAAGSPLTLTANAADVSSTGSTLRRGQQFWTFQGRGLDLSGYEPIGQNDPGRPVAGTGLARNLGHASKNKLSIPMSALDLGSRLGYVHVPKSATKHGANQQVEVVGANSVHTLNLNLSGGGIIDSWTYVNEAASIASTQMLNRYDSYVRGIQASCSWVDAYLHELTRHQPMQGGNYWSLPSLSTDQTAPGSPVVGMSVETLSAISKRIEVITAPLDLDPDGGMGMAGLNTNHNGSRYEPALWRDLLLRLRLTLNYNDIEDLHKLSVACYYPWDLNLAYFDTELYAACFLDAGAFAELWARDPVAGDSTQINDGSTGDFYGADYRTYHQNAASVFENDVGIAGTSFLPSGSGAVAARGVSADDLAFAVYHTPAAGPETGAPIDFNAMEGGNVHVWAQNRGDSDGRDEANFVCLAQGTMLTGRLHSHARKVQIRKGWVENHRYLLTNSWTNVVSTIDSVRARGLF